MADLESVVDEMMQEQTEAEKATEETGETEEAATEEPPATDEAEAEEETAEEDQSDEEEDSEEDGESDDGEDESEEADDSEGDLISVLYEGEEIKVPLDELKRGYSGQRKVTEGLQSNAAERKSLAEERQQLNEAATKVLELYQSHQQQGYIPPPQMPSQQLAQEDPIAYVEALGQYNADVAAYQQQQQQLEYAQQIQRQQEQQQSEQFKAEQRRILQERIPEFADPKKAQAVGSEMMEYLGKMGVPREALEQVRDAASVELVYKAMQFDKLKEGQKKVSQKASQARPALKPGAKKSPQAPQARKIEAAKKRLQQTGSLEDAVALQMAENPI